ncbi:MAG: hypothetical protein KKD05_06740 [Candidatus Omnitrophica bacterium]|nr:hypothetical protein [Candidatus Omnitrophota bacterium]
MRAFKKINGLFNIFVLIFVFLFCSMRIAYSQEYDKHYILAQELYKLGKYAEAQTEFEKARQALRNTDNIVELKPGIDKVINNQADEKGLNAENELLKQEIKRIKKEKNEFEDKLEKINAKLKKKNKPAEELNKKIKQLELLLINKDENLKQNESLIENIRAEKKSLLDELATLKEELIDLYQKKDVSIKPVASEPNFLGGMFSGKKDAVEDRPAVSIREQLAHYEQLKQEKNKLQEELKTVNQKNLAQAHQYEQLMANTKKAEEGIAAKENEKEKVKLENKLLEQIIMALEKQREQLTAKTIQVAENPEAKQLQSEIEQKDKEISELKGQNAKILKEKEAAIEKNTQLEISKKKLEEENAVLAKKTLSIAQSGKKINELDILVETLNKKNQDLAEQLEKNQKAYDKINKELSKISEQRAGLEAQVSGLGSENKDMTKANTDLNVQNKKLEIENKELKDKNKALAEIENSVILLKKDIGLKEKEIKSAIEQNNKLGQLNAEFKTKADDLSKRIVFLEQEKKTSKSNLDILEADKKRIDLSIIELESINKEQQEQLLKKEKELELLAKKNGDLEKAKNNNKEFVKKNNLLLSENKKLLQSLQAVESDLKKKNREILNLQNEFSAKQTKTEELAAGNTELNAQVIGLRDQLSALEQLKQTIAAKVDVLESDKKLAVKEKNSLETQGKEQEKQLAKQEKEIELLNQKISELKKTKNSQQNLLDKNNALITEINKLKQDSLDLQSLSGQLKELEVLLKEKEAVQVKLQSEISASNLQRQSILAQLAAAQAKITEFEKTGGKADSSQEVLAQMQELAEQKQRIMEKYQKLFDQMKEQNVKIKELEQKLKDLKNDLAKSEDEKVVMAEEIINLREKSAVFITE